MSCWPTPIQFLLLQASLLGGDERDAALARLDEQARGEGLPSGSERLLPLVYWNLRDSGANLPSLRQATEPFYLRSWQRCEVSTVEAARALAALQEASIPAIVLKGPTLARAYADPTLRPASDLDILVPVERFADALGALSAAGWQVGAHPREDPVLQHALNLSGPPVDIDLHRHALEEFVGTRHDRDLWDASEPFVIRDQMTRSLSACDRLLHVCTHGLRWNETSNIHWVPDAVFLLRAEGEAFDWKRFAERAQAFDLALPVGEGLRYLERAFGVPVPSAVGSTLAASRPSWMRRLAYRARQRPPGERGLSDAVALRLEMRRRRRLALNLTAPAAFAPRASAVSRRGLRQNAAGVWRALRVSLTAAIRRS